MYLRSGCWLLFPFSGKGEETEEALRHSGYEELREESLKAGTVCHGDYSQHNVLFQGAQTAVTNFWHWNYDMQTADLCHFMRKILEKHNWDLHMGRGMLDTYCRARPLKRGASEPETASFLSLEVLEAL